jgi:hypothetical protein
MSREIRFPDRSARSEWLYRLSYPGPWKEHRTNCSEGRPTELVTSCVKNCLPNHVIEGKIEEMIKQGAGHMQLLDDLQEKRNILKTEEESLASTLWETCLRLTTRQTTQLIRVLHIRPVSHQFPCTSYLSRHHSRTILSFDTVRSFTYSYYELSKYLLKKHIAGSAFLTAVTTVRVLWEATLWSLQIHPHFVRTCCLLLSDKTSWWRRQRVLPNRRYISTRLII